MPSGENSEAGMSTGRPWLERLVWLGLGALLASFLFIVLGARRTVETDAAPGVPSEAMPSGGEDPKSVQGRKPTCYLGVALARDAVDVTAEMDGVLEEVRVRVGDQVERDQAIATLDTVTIKQQLDIERTNLRSAEAQKRREGITASQSAQEHQRRLALQGLLSREEEEAARFRVETATAVLEAAEAEVAQVEARIAQLEWALERVTMRAPFAGTVAQRYRDPGARVSLGTPVVRLISSDRLLARFAVPPEETGQVPVSTKVRVEFETLGIALPGVVEHLAPEIDAASQMVFAEARLVASDPKLPPIPSGSVARVSVAMDGAFESCLLSGDQPSRRPGGAVFLNPT